MSLYAYNRREEENIVKAEKELMFSIEKTYELYHLMLLLLLDVADIVSEKMDQARQKKMPSAEDLNPNRRFVDNAVIAQLRDNDALNRYIANKKLSWVNYPHTLRSIYNDMIEWDVYNLYMNNPTNTYQADKKFVVQFLTELLPSSEDLEACLEEMSIFWNDDMEYVTVMAGKTIKKFKVSSNSDQELMPLFKNEEDEEFVKILFRKVILNSAKYSELIDKHTTNWELDRIALMDIIVMQMAISEIIEFPDIPIKVTLNEYIEIAKYYCTSKSGTFVNGILDNIVKEIKENGQFTKTGRGLIDESVLK